MMFFRLFLLLPFLCLFSQIPLFDPPTDWECVLPQNLAPCIQIGYLGKGSSLFRPSINLAIEEIENGTTLKKYLRSVKEIHLAERGTTWRDLGKFVTRSGEGRLTEIGTTSAFGPVKMLQFIYVSDSFAYILTGATTKDDFISFQEKFLQTFQSLRLIPDLFSPLASEKKLKFEIFFSHLKESIADKTEKETRWQEAQKMVLQESETMGHYWQFLVLKEAREKIYQ